MSLTKKDKEWVKDNIFGVIVIMTVFSTLISFVMVVNSEGENSDGRWECTEEVKDYLNIRSIPYSEKSVDEVIRLEKEGYQCEAKYLEMAWTCEKEITKCSKEAWVKNE